MVHFQAFSISKYELYLSLHIGKKCELQTLFATCIFLMCGLQLLIGQTVQIGLLGQAVENGFGLCWILLVSYSLDGGATVSKGGKNL